MSISDIEDDSNYETDLDTDNEDPNKELTTYNHLKHHSLKTEPTPWIFWILVAILSGVFLLPQYHALQQQAH